MKKSYYSLFFFFFYISLLSAQHTTTDQVEFGISLFSFTNERESTQLFREIRETYGGVLNGFIFKYHRKRYSFRIQLRVIGVQGTEVENSNGPNLGNNYHDVGFQLGTGFEYKFVDRKKFQWSLGAEVIGLRVKETDFFTDGPGKNQNYSGYSMGGLYIVNGWKLKASRHLSFIWEMGEVLGVLTRKDPQTGKRDWLGQDYFNPVGIFGITISWNKKKEPK